MMMPQENRTRESLCPQVTRRPFHNSDFTLPLLGFGLMRLPQTSGDQPEIDKKKVREMIADAMAAGVNYFDTAYMYHDGLSECCAGELLSEYPRDSYLLTDKMPAWFAKDPAGVEAIFEEQLKRCKTEYFDFYLVHSLDAPGWELAKERKVYEFLSRKKAEGRIRELGFSFHDKPAVLKNIASEYDWDFAQIQLNVLDWEVYQSKEQYEILTERNLPVIVMEPLRGGTLAALNPAATEILKNADPHCGNAAWGLRFAASLPNVICVLSGMSNPVQMRENLHTFAPLKPLTDDERRILDHALMVYRKNLAVPCTGCRYCMPCPAGVEIPRIFGHYNQYKVNHVKWAFDNNYRAIPERSRASACLGCGKCKTHCPQHIDIPEQLRKITEEME